MVTKYDSHEASIPPHCDDEDSIELDSVIMTITLGASRPVVFRRKPPGAYQKLVMTPVHGSLYLMTRASQNFFDHSVPQVEQSEFSGTRISITCRMLKDPFTDPPQQTQQTRSVTPRPPKRVLILSDSKNSTFDCSKFREPVVAFREDLFYLRDLENHRESIQQSDVVLISAGFNDLKKVRDADPWTLHNHVKAFVSQFSNVQFLFDSISPLSMNADRFNYTNDRIDRLNILLLELSLKTQNFKLFDNTKFGLSHLARDGIHMNFNGKSVLSDCWVHAILLILGLRRGPLPLRRSFEDRVEQFRFHSRVK